VNILCTKIYSNFNVRWLAQRYTKPVTHPDLSMLA
jgi:hypothetical protein